MIYNLLVFDDEYESRRRYYERLTDGHKHLGYRFDVVGVTKLEDFQRELAEKKFDAVLLDVVLSSNERLTAPLIDQAIAAVPAGMPLAYISNNWVGASFETLRRVWERRPLEYAFSFRELVGENNWPAVLLALASMVKSSKGLSSLVIDDGQPIRIVHLSDFHFGMTIPKADADVINDSLNQLNIARHARVRWRGISESQPWPLVLAITGDIAQSGYLSEYQSARIWLGGLLEKFSLALPSDRMLMVPGNHDCCLELAAVDRVKCDPHGTVKVSVGGTDPAARDRFRTLPFLNFNDFAKQVSTAPYWQYDNGGRYWVDARFADAGVVFFGINSANGINVDDMKATRVADDDLAALAKELQHFDDSILRIGMVHNPPDPEGGAGGSKKTYVEPYEAFRAYSFDHFKTDMWLHGHAHQFHSRIWLNSRGKGSSVVVGAAAPRNPTTKQALDERRGFSFIDVWNVGQRQPRIEVLSFQYDSGQVEARDPVIFSKDDGVWSRT